MSESSEINMPLPGENYRKTNAKRSVLQNSIAVSAATMLLRTLGFLRELILAATYGAGVVTDAFVIAMTAPGIVLAVVNNAVSASFTPQYASAGKKADEFTNTILTLLFISGLAFALTFTIFPQSLVYVFASRLAPETFDLATRLLRIMVWSSIPLLIVGVLRAFLNIKSKFFIALAADAVVNVAIILSILAGKVSGITVAIGFGAVIGNILCVTLLLAICFKNGFKFRPGVNLRNPQVRSMFYQMAPIIISVSITEINYIVDKNFASSLVSGTVSSLNYAAKINGVVLSLVGVSIGAALLPAMSTLAANNGFAELKERLVACISAMFPLLLPLTVGFALMAKPGVRILLERGAFNSNDTIRTAECLQMYALGILAGNLNVAIVNTFYAMKRTKWPAMMSAISVLVGIALNLLLVKPLQHRGLALATSASTTLNMSLMLIALRKWVGPLGLRSQLKEFMKIGLATAIMGVFIVIATRFSSLDASTYSRNLLLTIVIVGTAVILYCAALLVMKSKFIWNLTSKFLKKTA
ncbi:MAG: murein biosynthesis integral membrane protein MurJ [Clostridiales bacterium]|jgi:putative peptidoglycan lipid II flippase|nr:murein biosynthesis integral membrane protein MurJ [Clostridiales bacterium]